MSGENSMVIQEKIQTLNDMAAMNKNLTEQVKHTKLLITRLEEELIRKQESENTAYEELQYKY